MGAQAQERAEWIDGNNPSTMENGGLGYDSDKGASTLDSD
jgi:hypothetical protein